MRDSNAIYESIVGPAEGANRLHVHATELLHPEKGWGAQHSHRAEEAIYMLEGEGEFTFGGKKHRVGPGQAVFFPPGVTHAETRFSKKVRYLVIRTVEPGDEPCCCVAEPATARAS